MIDKKILRIESALSALTDVQIAVEGFNDADLGYRMWGGRDGAGTVSRWLAKGLPGLLETIKLDGSGTTGEIGLLRHDTAGLVTGKLMTVAELNTYLSDGPIGEVDSVFGRTGAVIAVQDDYTASLVDNDSSVSGTTVKDALETLDGLISDEDLWDRSGTDTYLKNTGDDLGVGTTSPLYKLDVRGILATMNAGGDSVLNTTMIVGNPGFPATQDHRIRASTSGNPVLNKLLIETSNGTTGFYNDNQLVLQGDGCIGVGTIDLDGTPAIGKLTVKGSTNDGSTNTLVGRDSDEANVFSVSTNGDIDILAGAYYKYNGSNFSMAQTALDNYFTCGAGNLTMTGADNTACGYTALDANTTGLENTAIGKNASGANTGGGYNVAVGVDALSINTAGGENVAVGNYALIGAGVSNSNVGVGMYAGKATTSKGTENVAIGRSALDVDQYGEKNVAIGAYAGGAGTTTLGDNNVLIGHCSGKNLESDNNITIGFQAGDNITTGGTNLIIGHNLNAPSATASNQLVIGGIISGDMSTGDVDLTGSLSIGSVSRIESDGYVYNRTPVNAATYTTLTTDDYIGVEYTPTGTVTVTLESDSVRSGKMVVFKDEGGNAGTNAITIDTEGSELIDGGASIAIDTDYGNVTLFCDGADWFKIANGGGAPAYHAPSHVDGTDDIQDATISQKGLATAAHINAIVANTAKVTCNTANVDAAGAMMNSDWATNTIYYGTGTAQSLFVNTKTVLGRKASGPISSMSPSETRDVIGCWENASFTGTLTTAQGLRGATSIYWNYRQVDAFSLSSGGSGATFTAPDANVLGGWQLDAVGEKLYFTADVHDDWDAATDINIDIYFETNADNGGGGGGDTVDFDVEVYMKGDGETATKNQSLTATAIIGAAAQYTRFEASTVIDYDDGSNPVQVGDIISIVVNLNTGTSEVDDVIVNHFEIKYRTKQPALEV